MKICALCSTTSHVQHFRLRSWQISKAQIPIVSLGTPSLPVRRSCDSALEPQPLSSLPCFDCSPAAFSVFCVNSKWSNTSASRNLLAFLSFRHYLSRPPLLTPDEMLSESHHRLLAQINCKLSSLGDLSNETTQIPLKNLSCVVPERQSSSNAKLRNLQWRQGRIGVCMQLSASPHGVCIAHQNPTSLKIACVACVA